jgi:hypothetical protein
MIKRFLKSMLLPNHAVSGGMGRNPISLKALKDHGLITNNSLSIAVGSSSRIRRAYLNAKLMDLFDKLEDVEFYSDAAEICKKIIDLKLDYPDSIMIGTSVSDGGIPGTEEGHQRGDESIKSQMMDELDEILSVDDPRKVPLDIRHRIIDHYIGLMEEMPLITEDDFRVSIYAKDNLTDKMLDDPEYRSKIIRTVVECSCNNSFSDQVADNMLQLGLSYKEMIMGGYFLSVINKCRQGMRRTNEEQGLKPNIIMDNIFDICIPYSLGITLKEFTIDELRVKLEETLKITEEDV